MMSWNDRTYCASPKCQNECGRQMTDEEKRIYDSVSSTGFAPPVAYGYFCGEPDDEKQ